MSGGDCCSDRWGLVARCSSRVVVEEEAGGGGGRRKSLLRIVHARGAIPNEGNGFADWEGPYDGDVRGVVTHFKTNPLHLKDGLETRSASARVDFG